MMKFINEIEKEDLNGKKVLLRVDFNVSTKEEKIPNGKIQTRIVSDFKINAQKETINYLLENGAKILLVSHHNQLQSFLPILEEISTILGQIISLVPHTEFSSLDLLLQTAPLLLLDNVRQDPREEKNDEEFAKSLSNGFDFFVNDAFAVSHRRHASVSAVAKLLPSYGGFLMKKEVENLSQAVETKAEGKVLVLGGAKISTKLSVIQNFLDKAEKILIGGALANDFWQTQGINIGASLVDDSVAVNQLGNHVSKLILPRDILISKGWTLEKVKSVMSQGSTLGSLKVEPLISEIRDLNPDEAIVDIGPQSAQDFAKIIKNSETVVWNGPLGLSEVGKFASGTSIIAKVVAEAKKSIIGGGDTITAVAKLGLLDKFGYVSTGGGAMLEFLAGRRLPGLEALGYYN